MNEISIPSINVCQDPNCKLHKIPCLYWPLTELVKWCTVWNAYKLLPFDPVRVCLLLMLAHCLGAVFVLEQPASSLLPRHDRFRWLVHIWNNIGIKVICWSYSLFLEWICEFAPRKTMDVRGFFGKALIRDPKQFLSMFSVLPHAPKI